MKPVIKLNTKANMLRCDDVYEALINVHTGLSPQESMRLNIKLVLFLTNHIGHADVIFEAIAKAANPK
ncbi:MAG: DUF2783 domain-containing protein [Robiginitomaculum sp.]|nr:DUF2783 domain-containing protein [Robiginitomaculum sp.]